MNPKEHKGERVYCERCPIVLVCYGQNDTEPTYSSECVLAKLYNGELKVTIPNGYISKE
jgi:hypothetical protein